MRSCINLQIKLRIFIVAVSTHVRLCVCLCVCICVCVHDIPKKNGSIHLKLEHIVVHWALSDQGQGHTLTLRFFSIYHNTNCEVLNLTFGRNEVKMLLLIIVNEGLDR